MFDDDFALETFALDDEAEANTNEDRHVLYANNNCVRFSIQNAVTGKSTPSLQLHQEESDQEYRRRKTTDLPTKEAASSQYPALHLHYSQMQRLQTSKGKRVVKYTDINKQPASRDEKKA